MKTYLEKHLEGLAKTLHGIKTEEELQAFLSDLLTEKEIEKLAERIRVMYYLTEPMSQREIQKEAKVAIATVSRGAQLFKKPNKVFHKVIEKVQSSAWFWDDFRCTQ